jgi:hypothetical protein
MSILISSRVGKNPLAEGQGAVDSRVQPKVSSAREQYWLRYFGHRDHLYAEGSVACASKRLMAKGHICYCGMVRGPHVEK